MPVQIRLENEDEVLLSNVKLILKDKNGKNPTSKGAIRKCMQIVQDNGYQMNGADVRNIDLKTKPEF